MTPRPAPERPLRAVLLDIDGTLVDSNDAHAQAWFTTLREFEIEADLEHIRRLIGMGGDKLLPKVTGIEKDSPRGRELTKRRAEIFQNDLMPKVKPFPRVRDLLGRFRADGLHLVVATSAPPEEVSALLRIAHVQDLIDSGASAGDADHSKPDPDIITAALRKSGFAAAETMMLGDTPYDVAAAGSAGVRAVALRCGGWDDESLLGALAIYDDPANLLASYSSSPFAAALAPVSRPERSRR